MKWFGWTLPSQIAELNRRADACEAVSNRAAATNLRTWAEKLEHNDQLARKSGLGS